MQHRIGIAVVCVMMIQASTGLALAEKNRDWQMGTVRDTSTGSTGNTTASQSKASVVAFTTVQISSDKYFYEASERGKISKRPRLTVNGSVKFAVDEKKRKLYLIDEDGKEHELDITKKIPLTTP